MPSNALVQDWPNFLRGTLAFLPRLISGLAFFFVSLGAAGVAGRLVAEAVKRRDAPPRRLGCFYVG